MYDRFFEKAGAGPVYEQLAAYFKELIANGSLVHGSALLSQRDYCSIFNLSRPTVHKAFEILERECLINITPKKRATVCSRVEGERYIPVEWNKYVKKSRYAECNERYKNLNFMRGSHGIINLFECYFGDAFAPINPVKKAMELVVKDMPDSYIHTNLDVRGTLSLRQAICGYLSKSGIYADPSQVLVCNTLQNAYNIVFEALSNEYTNCYMEKDSVFLGERFLNGIPIPLDNEGIMLGPLTERLKTKRQGFLLVDTYYSMPSGITYSKRRKTDLIKLSQEWQLPIVESEVIKDCWHNTTPSPSMKSMDLCRNVVYIFSLARPFMSVLTTAIVAPEALMPVLMDIKLQNDEYTEILAQHVLEKLLVHGIYDDYMRSIRPLVISHYADAEKLVAKYFSDIASWQPAEYGVNMRVDFDFDISRIFPELEKHGIMLYPPQMFSSTDNFLWFCYTGVGYEKLDYALCLINEHIRRLL